MKGKWLLIIAIIGILTVTGLSLSLYFAFKPPPAVGIMITDDLGRTVYIDGIPQRVIALAPSAAEILFALGQGNKIVGVTDQCDYPEEARAKPKVGAFWDPSVEQIVALGPDLVLSHHKPELIPQLEEIGITVIVLRPEDIDGILHDVMLIGQVIGAEERAQSLVAGMEQRIQAVTSKVENAARPGVFYEGDCGFGIWTAGPGTFVNELISLAGGRNVGAMKEGYYKINNEVLLEANDAIDVIIWADMGGVPFASVANSLPWSGLTAVQTGKVYVLDPDLVNRPGPRIVDCLEEIARIIHPELFG